MIIIRVKNVISKNGPTGGWFLTMSAGGSLKAEGLGRGVVPEAVGRPDRLV